MAILEAAKYGKPMIAPNHGGFSEIIGQGEDAIGVLTKPGVVRGLEKAVVSLWNNPEEAQRLGRKAFEKLKERYASDVVAQQWKALLEDLNGHIF